jgi:hypothetical protein
MGRLILFTKSEPDPEAECDFTSMWAVSLKHILPLSNGAHSLVVLQKI